MTFYKILKFDLDFFKSDDLNWKNFGTNWYSWFEYLSSISNQNMALNFVILGSVGLGLGVIYF